MPANNLICILLTFSFSVPFYFKMRVLENLYLSQTSFGRPVDLLDSPMGTTATGRETNGKEISGEADGERERTNRVVVANQGKGGLESSSLVGKTWTWRHNSKELNVTKTNFEIRKS